ncbi:MAG: UDP-N-acetylmuramate dehydrogenase [Bdellovibrionales bacterium]
MTNTNNNEQILTPKLILKNHSLKDLNSWRVATTAQYFAAPATEEELKEVWHWAWKCKLRSYFISGGSNILFTKDEVKGVVISLHELKGIISVQSTETISIQCWAGTPKSEIAKIFIQNRLPPAVFITGIPGDMGGGVVMNAGIGENRTPREFCEIVYEIEVLRLNELTGEFSHHNILGRDIKWEYRHSSGWQPGIITKVTVHWPHVADMSVHEGVKNQTQKRVKTQPLNLPSCGSVFRNPLGHKSAQLIERCGLKGYRVGGACVSEKHANFIVNDRGATAQDICAIIKHVRATVLDQAGVELKTEVVFLDDVQT